jgi:hypothetical protein
MNPRAVAEPLRSLGGLAPQIPRFSKKKKINSFFFLLILAPPILFYFQFDPPSWEGGLHPYPHVHLMIYVKLLMIGNILDL